MSADLTFQRLAVASYLKKAAAILRPLTTALAQWLLRHGWDEETARYQGGDAA